MILQKVISSGQPGVDECVLRVAQTANLQTGGVCAIQHEVNNHNLGIHYMIFPDGLINSYMHQSRANIDAADGTLALWLDSSPGVKKNIIYATSKQWPLPIGMPQVSRKNGERASLYKPLFVICALDESEIKAVNAFLTKHEIRTLNVVGSHKDYEDIALFFEKLFIVK
jgi:hypothetical protein